MATFEDFYKLQRELGFMNLNCSPIDLIELKEATDEVDKSIRDEMRGKIICMDTELGEKSAALLLGLAEIISKKGISLPSDAEKS